MFRRCQFHEGYGGTLLSMFEPGHELNMDLLGTPILSRLAYFSVVCWQLDSMYLLVGTWGTSCWSNGSLGELLPPPLLHISVRHKYIQSIYQSQSLSLPLAPWWAIFHFISEA